MNHALQIAMIESGQTAESLAAQVGVDPKTAARWVSRGRVPQTRHRAQVAALVGKDIEDLWPDVARRRYPTWLREWIEHERDARLLRWFEPALVPGVLQTEAYARAVLSFGGLMNEGEVEERATSRIERQVILAGSRPPQVFAILDEAILRRRVGSREIMAEQCAHLIRLAERPHVHIQVVPADAGGHAGLAGGFILAKGPLGGGAAHLDDPLQARVVTQQADIDRLEAVWESIRAVALPTALTLDLLKEVAPTWQT
ncbi:Scr1 family TA system antitoxin-like transcriptional regulator [Micromonospora sp. NPDC050417]|uniref:Scr1 family TA system antitoxin-like transcriptional regulator n=1 Tax=Micromonospora sp. NPDC050417 TaxID=3364280 RepID=UPI0037B9168C